ncbi:MAG: hypothetical protein RLZZ519_1168 [Bacteroidota bacterium]|jgi:hypothetical protein
MPCLGWHSPFSTCCDEPIEFGQMTCSRKTIFNGVLMDSVLSVFISLRDSLRSYFAVFHSPFSILHSPFPINFAA